MGLPRVASVRASESGFGASGRVSNHESIFLGVQTVHEEG